jgi:hypothetical protein
MNIVCRCFGILLAAVIGMGAADATAQQPIPDRTAIVGQTCLVDAAPGWTPQEIWTWRRICIGRNAELALRPQGDVDGDEIPDPSIVSPGSRNPDNASRWPADRILRARFLEQILLHEPYRSVMTHAGIRIVGAHFAEPIDLSNAVIAANLEIIASAFDEDVKLRGVHSTHGLSFAHGRFAKTLDLQLARIGGDLDITRAAALSILLDDATIDNKLFASGMTARNWLRMDSIDVKSDIYLHDADVACLTLEEAEIANTLSLERAHIRFSVNLGGLHAGSSVFLDDITVDQYQPPVDPSAVPACAQDPMRRPPAADNRPALLPQRAALKDAAIDGSIFMDHAYVGVDLDMQEMRIGAHVMMRAGGDFGMVNLSGSEIGSLLSLNGSTFWGPLEMTSIKVGKAIQAWPDEVGDGRSADATPENAQCKLPQFKRGIWAPGAQIQGNLVVKGASFTGPVNLRGAQIAGMLQFGDEASFEKPVDMTFTRIGSNLDLTKGRFGSLDLTGASIGGELRLATDDNDRSTISNLIVRNVSAKALQDIPDVWPDKAQLDGFTYTQLGGFRANLDPSEPAQPARCEPGKTTEGTSGASALDARQNGATRRGICGRLARLKADIREGLGLSMGAQAAARGQTSIENRSACEFVDWLGKQEEYSPQPYTQLASVLQRSGQPEKGRWVLFEGKFRELGEASWLRTLGLGFEMLIVGFGLYPWIAGGWAILLVAAGTVLLRHDSAPHLEHFTLADRVVYSVDMLLPVIELKKGNYEFDLYSWPKYYFYFHKVMGYVLVGFVIASIGGMPGE